MAVLEIETNNYFKVNFTQSFVQKNMVFAAFTVYVAEVDRHKEKHRLDKFIMFDENCKNLLNTLNDSEQNEEFYLNFFQAVEYIKNNRYAINISSALRDMYFSEEITRLLIDCGYQPEWLMNPICIVSKHLVNCGMYGDELFTSEYVYGKLKAKMKLDIKDI